MKALAVLLCVLSLSLVACSASPATPDPVANIPSAGNEEPTPMPSSEAELNELLFVECSDVVDPQVLADALPSSFNGHSIVGDIVTERTDYPDMEGKPQPQSNALKTLTRNDEYYVALSALDSCGLNTIRASAKQLTAGESIYGTTRALELGPHRGFITAAPDGLRYYVDVLIADRVTVHIDADPEFGEANTVALAQAIDYDAIARAIPSS